jgi:peptidoglycan/LPS O-acetylase OafA/YrhL
MSRELSSFVIKISQWMILLIIAGFVVFKWVAPGYFDRFYGVTALFFYLFTIGVHAWQLNSLKKKMVKFTNANMIVTFVKLLFYSAFTIIYISTKPENPAIFVLVVMVLYATFTFIEVSSLTKVTRSQKNSQAKS